MYFGCLHEIEINVERVIELLASLENRKLSFESKTVLSWYVSNANAKLKALVCNKAIQLNYFFYIFLI